jgi:hypothetical protein
MGRARTCVQRGFVSFSGVLGRAQGHAEQRSCRLESICQRSNAGFVDDEGSPGSHHACCDMHRYGFVAPGEHFIDGAELDSDLLVLASSQYDRGSERTGHVSRLTLRKPGKEISAKLSKARDLDGHLANEQLDIGEVAVGLKTGATQEHVARDDRRRAASGHACDRQAQVIASAVRRKLEASRLQVPVLLPSKRFAVVDPTDLGFSCKSPPRVQSPAAAPTSGSDYHEVGARVGHASSLQVRALVSCKPLLGSSGAGTSDSRWSTLHSGHESASSCRTSRGRVATACRGSTCARFRVDRQRRGRCGRRVGCSVACGT